MVKCQSFELANGMIWKVKSHISCKSKKVSIIKSTRNVINNQTSGKQTIYDYG